MRRLRWGLIGCGDIARKRVAPALRDLPECELVAISRARVDLAESFAAEFGAGRWHERWQDLVADKDIDAVYIATPVLLHAEQAIAAARQGKHVLCEKPMALDTGECDRMVAACRESGVNLGIAYYRHFYPVIDRIKAIIGSGEIGRAVLAQVNAFEWFDPAPGDPRRWLIEKTRSGGGPMFDFGCHRIEVLSNIFGPVRRATGFCDNLFFAREVEDTCAAFLEFESKARALLTVTHAAREPQDTLDIYGTEGSLHIPVLNEGRVEIRSNAGPRVELLPPHPNLHRPLIEDFARSVIEGRDPSVAGEAGREVARVIEAIYRETEI